MHPVPVAPGAATVTATAPVKPPALAVWLPSGPGHGPDEYGVDDYDPPFSLPPSSRSVLAGRAGEAPSGAGVASRLFLVIQPLAATLGQGGPAPKREREGLYSVRTESLESLAKGRHRVAGDRARIWSVGQDANSSQL